MNGAISKGRGVGTQHLTLGREGMPRQTQATAHSCTAGEDLALCSPRHKSGEKFA